MSRPLPEAELLEAVHLVRDWSPLRGARIFITGGTGFFGRWLLETLGAAERSLGLGVKAVVLSRNPDRFLLAMPHLREAPWLSFQLGDITSFQAPEGSFSHLIHGAGSSDARENMDDPVAMRRTIVEGTRHVMESMAKQTALRVVFVSSGAVYGPQPRDLARIPDDFPVQEDPSARTPAQIYAQAKREAERIASDTCADLGLSCSTARCFTFAGPHLPLDQHFAFGNFIRDALAGRAIHVQGDGTPCRSYLYASELAAWLWALATRGESTTYNVGSDLGISIQSLAEEVGQEASVPVHIAQRPIPGRESTRYVPEVTRIEKQLGLSPMISIRESIRRSLRWYRG